MLADRVASGDCDDADVAIATTRSTVNAQRANEPGMVTLRRRATLRMGNVCPMLE
jgi:hypothetical protein